MATFREKLLAAGRGNPPAVAALTFLNDLGGEERTILREEWPRLPSERRRHIVGELVQMAVDNIELDFRHTFLNALLDTDADVRLTAIEGLYEDESRLLLGRLLDMVRRDPDTQVRAASALALARFAFIAHCGNKLGDGGDKLRRALLEVAEDQAEGPDVRRRAIEALGYFHGDKDVERLIIQAYESGGHEAESALFAMGRNLDARWQVVVLDELESKRPAMRYEAARAAGEMALEDALPMLVRLAEDKDTEVKLASIWALGQIGGRPAAEALAKASKSTEPAVREAAREAMDELAFNDNPLSV